MLLGRLAVTRHLLLLALLTGCFQTSAELEAPAQEDDMGAGSGSGAPANLQCREDSDCVPAAATCCECPTFATRADDPGAASCSEVECGELECAATASAVCTNGSCALACAPLACETSCPDGYARDPNGCLTCACAPVVEDGCEADSDCARTAGDCCGCARGGIDVAVPAGTEQAYQNMLGCSGEEPCPDVNTCRSGDAPQCVQGSCALVGPLPAGACGRPDLPSCGAGATCTVNANDQADMHGVGICQTP